MNFNNQLLNLNQKLSTSGAKLRVEQRGQRLCLRGPLPIQETPHKLKTQRISLGLPSNPEGLKQAEKTLQLILLQLEHQQFNWENWIKRSFCNSITPQKRRVDDVISEFKLSFFKKTTTRDHVLRGKTTWNSAYKPYLRRLEEQAGKSKCTLNKEIFLATLLSYSENSRSRQQCGIVLNALANHLKISLPANWRKLSYGYGIHKAQFRELPSDEVIQKMFKLIPNKKWQLVFGLMATYGLRNHEVFFCDLSSLKEKGDKIIRVLPNTKTGEHQVWPFHPEWVQEFNLIELGEGISILPKVQTDLAKTTLQQVGRRVSEQFKRYKLPFTPYDLRHAWAVRTIHIGLPDTVSARMMGHSVSIHTRTYHHWITRRDQQKAVDAALKNQTAKKNI